MKKQLVLLISTVLLISCSSANAASSTSSISSTPSTTSESSKQTSVPSTSTSANTSSSVSSSSLSRSSANTNSISSSSSAPTSAPTSAPSSNPASSSSSISSSNSAVSSSESSSNSSIIPSGIVTKTVSFYNGGFTNSSLENAKSQSQFVEWFNNGDNTLASINYVPYAQLNYIGNEKDTWRFSTLILGSQNEAGKITFNFNIDVLSIKMVVQPYTKYISFNNTYNIDKSAIFLIDNKEYDLSLPADHDGETENVTINHQLTSEVKSFSISNKEAGQRVFVHSLEITYQG